VNTAQQLPAIGSAYTANVRRWQALMTELARLAGVPRADVEAECRSIIRAASGQGSSKGLDARGWGRLFVWLDEQLGKYREGVDSRFRGNDERKNRAPDESRDPEKGVDSRVRGNDGGNDGDMNGELAASSNSCTRNRKAKAPTARGHGADLLSSSAQRYALETLRQLCEMSGEDFMAFCRKKFGFAVPATRGQGNKTINALKPMALHRHQVKARIGRALDLPNLDAPDRAFLADVLARFGNGKQGASVRIGSIPIALKILGRYGIEKSHATHAD